MDLHADYQQSDIGKIPKDWKLIRLDEACLDITDGSHFSPKEDKNGQYRIATVANIRGNQIDESSCKKISKEDYKKLVKNGCKPNKGDILFSKDGTVGLTFSYKQNLDLALLSSIAIIRPKTTLDSDYCSYALKSPSVFRYIVGSKRGTGLTRIILKDLKKIKIPLPESIEEQQKIAEILSAADDAILKVAESIKKTERVKQGLMQKLLTEGIGHKEFKDTEIGRIPKEWKVNKLINMATLQRGHDLPNQQRIEGQFPVIGSNDIVGYHAEYKHTGPGVMIGRSGTLGNVYYTNLNYWPLNTSLYVKDFHGNFPKYIYYFFQNISIEKYYAGTGVPTLNRNLLHPVKYPIPTLAEQKKIVEILDSVEEKLDLLKKKKERFQNIKKGLMNDLLTGRKRVQL